MAPVVSGVSGLLQGSKALLKEQMLEAGQVGVGGGEGLTLAPGVRPHWPKPTPQQHSLANPGEMDTNIMRCAIKDIMYEHCKDSGHTEQASQTASQRLLTQGWHIDSWKLSVHCLPVGSKTDAVAVSVGSTPQQTRWIDDGVVSALPRADIASVYCCCSMTWLRLDKCSNCGVLQQDNMMLQ